MTKPDTYLCLHGVQYDVYIDSYKYWPEGVRFVNVETMEEVVNVDNEYDDLLLKLESMLREEALSRLA